MATVLATKNTGWGRGGCAIRTAGVCAKGISTEACSEMECANGAAKRARRGAASRDRSDEGACMPDKKLAASADRLNKIRAVKRRVVPV